MVRPMELRHWKIPRSIIPINVSVMVTVLDDKALVEAETVGGRVWSTLKIILIRRMKRMTKNATMMKTVAWGYDISISVPPVPQGAYTQQW